MRRWPIAVVAGAAGLSCVIVLVDTTTLTPRAAIPARADSIAWLTR